MGAEPQLHFELNDIDARLSRMGTARELFIKAAKESYAAFAACTINDPPTFPGTAAWSAANRSLRESHFSYGWTRKNETNLPIIVNLDGTLAITAASGDEDTGRKEGSPSTRSPKGVRTRDYVRRNQTSFDFMEALGALGASSETPKRSTWLFLIYRDFGLGEIRFELSLPQSMAVDGHVDGWAERIIFPSEPIDTTENINPISGENDGGQSPEITVEIRKLG
jgi:hypothetical protein